MEDQLRQIVEKFLTRHHDGKRAILLALSGGPDSLTLLHLLRTCCAHLNIRFAIAHLDHGWREESGQEASQLEALSHQLQVTFHCKKISPLELKGNLEAVSRKARLLFFSDLCRRYDYQAVLFAHHQDDQAETVLKNVLEGANLSSCSGMLNQVTINGLTIWRPLLDVSKNTILKWLKNKKLTPFLDPTNQDPRFLRGRLRTQIIPELSHFFGKEIISPLCQIGKDAQELHQYLKEKLNPLIQSIEMSPTGSFLDLSSTCPQSPLEVKFLIRQLCQQHHCFLSREMIEKGANHLLLRSANRKFMMGKFTLYIDRGRLFLSVIDFSKIPIEREVLRGTMQYGPWLVTTEELNKGEDSPYSDWQEIWKGRAEVILPLSSINRKTYQIGSPRLNHPFPRSSPLRKWWNHYKVPAFLRSVTPVIWSAGQIAHEFLSGEKIHKVKTNEDYLQVVLSRQNEFENE